LVISSLCRPSLGRLAPTPHPLLPCSPFGSAADPPPQSEHLLPAHHALLNDLITRSDQAGPTAFHNYLARLEDEGRLLRCYTQNIDGLERKAGLEVGIRAEPNVSKAKRSGSVSSGSAAKRRKTSSWEEDREPLEGSVEMDKKHDVNADTKPKALSNTATPLGPPTPPSPQSPAPSPPRTGPPAAVAAPAPTPPAYTPAHRVIPLHGQLDTVVCGICKWTDPIADYFPLPGRSIACGKCMLGAELRSALSERSRPVGALRASVVLYGEDHPQGESIGSIVERDLKGTGRRGEREGKADLLIVAGTSLAIPGVKRIVKEMSRALSVRQGVRTIYVNAEPPHRAGAEWDNVFDVWVRGDVQAFVTDLLDNPAYLIPPTPPKTPRKRKATAPASVPSTESGYGVDIDHAPESSGSFTLTPMSGTSTPIPTPTPTRTGTGTATATCTTKAKRRSTTNGPKRAAKRFGDSSDFTTPTKVPKRRAFLLTPESTPSEKSEAVGRAERARGEDQQDQQGLHDIIRATEQRQQQRLDPLTLARSVTHPGGGGKSFGVGRLDFGGKGTGLEREESLTPLSDGPDPFV
jgi:NAD-dependent SIR2 family protein deacetylase